MFRKLVSNLAFSPALVGQLGFYAKRLKKEEATRRVGFMFTALALVVQSFAVFSPPEAANASNPSNFIDGGVSSLSGYVANYDANTNNIQDLFNSVGITRDEVLGAQQQYLNSKRDGLISWGLTPLYSAAQGEGAYTARTASGGTRTFWHRPLTTWDSLHGYSASGSNYYIYVGWSAKAGWFGLSKNCGNLITKTIPPPPPMCTVAGKESLPADSPSCKEDAVAACVNLKITPLINNYQFDTEASTGHGATISSYTYTVKRGNDVVETKTISSPNINNTYVYSQQQQGNYTVSVSVQTSVGDKSGAECVKTFNIAPPEMCPQNPNILKSSPECQPCPGDSTIWIKDSKCKAEIIQTKSAQNTTQSKNAISAIAQPSDRIVYSLNVENKGLAPAKVTITEQLSDVLEYATIIDNGGGTLIGKTLQWPEMTLKPGEKQTRMFTSQMLSSIPAMGQGVSDPSSYDCNITNTFGNSVEIRVDCPVQKVAVERTVAELPHTGPRENMIFAGVVFTIVAYFYVRSRQLKKEVRLIRRDLNAGTI